MVARRRSESHAGDFSPLAQSAISQTALWYVVRTKEVNWSPFIDCGVGF